MYADIVFPKNNEEKFVEMGLVLGYSKLYFVYDSFKEYKSDKIEVICGVKNQGKGFIVAKANESIRPVLEKGKVDLVYGFEDSERNDYMHHRNSGLNQVLCKIMKEKGISLGFSFSSILNSKNQQLLGRVMQNIKFARKYKIKMVLGSFSTNPYEMRAPKDLIAFGQVLGMHAKEAQEALK